MFRAQLSHHQEVKLYYTVSGIVTLCRWPSDAQVDLRIGRPDTRICALSWSAAKIILDARSAKHKKNREIYF